jgi:hypothetical protein
VGKIVFGAVSPAYAQKLQYTNPASGISNATPQFISSNYKLLTLKNVHYGLTACGINPSPDPFSLISSTVCDLVDTTLYAATGDYKGAALSGASLLPSVLGAAGSLAKGSRLLLAGLRDAKGVTALLTEADKVKVVAASSNNVKVLTGSADEGLEVFEVQTKGWKVMPDGKATDGSKILIRESVDGKYTMGYRTKSTGEAQGDFTKINATIDVQKMDPAKAYLDVLEKIEIKFAE